MFLYLLVPTNLISVGQLVDNNCDVHFSRSSCVVQDSASRKMLTKVSKVGRLFPLHISPFPVFPSSISRSFACNAISLGNDLWHRRLGHLNSYVLRTLFDFGLLENKTCFSFDLSFDCTACKIGKSKVLPFPSHGFRASQYFDIIYSNVWEISPIISQARYKYFVMFIEDFSRFTRFYFLLAKAEVFLVFRHFLALLETQFSASIKIVRSDSGVEYMSNEFQDFLQSKGIMSHCLSFNAITKRCYQEKKPLSSGCGKKSLTRIVCLSSILV